MMRNIHPIFSAIRNGYSDQIKRMLQEEPSCVNEKDFISRTPLMRILQKDKWELAESMIEVSEIEIDHRDFEGTSALHLACIRQRN